MDELRLLLKTIRAVSKTNPVTYIQLSEIIRNLWRPRVKVYSVFQEAHGFIVGDVIKPADPLWVKAKADTEANAKATAIVSQIIDEDNFIFLQEGIIPGAYTIGAKYFLSIDIEGTMFIQSDPEIWTEGQYRQMIGTGTADGLLVEIDEGNLMSSSSGGGGNYVYVAYASDTLGTGFTLTSSNLLKYKATLISNTAMSSLVVTDFAGLWEYRGTSTPTTITSTTSNFENGNQHSHALDNVALAVGTFQFATVVIDAKGRVTNAQSNSLPSVPVFQVGTNAIVSATGAVLLATNIPVSYTRVLFRITWSLRNDTDIWEDMGEAIFASGGSVAKSNMKQVIPSDHSMIITVESDGGSPAKWNFKVTPPGGTFGFTGFLIMSIEKIYQFS